MASKKSTQASHSPSKHPSHHHRYLSMSTTSSSDDSPVYSRDYSPINRRVISSSTPPPLRYFGIPFSWEQFPGIPKKPSSKPDPNSLHNPLLPLPPSGYNYYRKERVSTLSLEKHHRQHSHGDSLRNDPFLAALIECSKDDVDGGGVGGHDGSTAGRPNQSLFDAHNKVTRSISDRLGFVGVYTSSCKRTCAVSESIMCISSRTTRPLGHRY